ncbi:MAG: hypothetical protein NTW03_10180 [Verrucomicrobia bacterium]|nr:hypothetical protein [Verrucomicrobiota bacterium]
MTRIGNIQLVDVTRAEFDDSASAADFTELAKQPHLKALQCSSPIPDTLWVLVNELFCAARPDVELRVYGHYTIECDLTFVRLLTNVRRFAADCLMSASNVEAIAAISGLESLSLGIFELTDFSILERISTRLTVLRLGATRSKKPSLAPLSRFRSLRVLYLEGHSKDIEVLSDLSDLEDVTLRSITTSDFSYLARQAKLWSLDIKLGGIRGFKGIEGKKSIKCLELWQVRDLHDIKVVGVLPGLQNLFLQSLPHVEAFPPLRDSVALRQIVVQNLKGLRDFAALETAPALEQFALLEGIKQSPHQLLPVLRNPKVRQVSAYFGSDRKNSEFVDLREKSGKTEVKRWEPFDYR